MSTILLDYPDNLTYFPRRTREMARRIIESSAAHRRAVEEGRSKQSGVSEPSDASSKPVGTSTMPCSDNRNRDLCWTEPNTSVSEVSKVLTDTQGSPSESQCSKSQLKNILTVREEREAAKARQTVRPVGSEESK